MRKWRSGSRRCRFWIVSRAFADVVTADVVTADVVTTDVVTAAVVVIDMSIANVSTTVVHSHFDVVVVVVGVTTIRDIPMK